MGDVTTLKPPPTGDSVAARLAVLPTKLEAPHRRPGIIERPRLLARLAAAETPVVALFAPPGYGKSTTLAQLATRLDRPVAWLSIDHRDSDPATLVRGLAAAIARVQPLDDDDLAAIATPGPSVWHTAIPRLWSRIADGPPSTIVIDDVGRLATQGAIDVVLSLADQLQGRLRLLLAARRPGLIHHARLVAAGRLTVVGREDLEVDEDEAAALLAAVGVRASKADVERVLEQSEGWAAGIYLSSLGGTPTTTAATGPSPTDGRRSVEEYLRAEVLGSMDPADVELLVRTSALDRLSGPLCDAVLGRDGSGEALERLERANLFVIAIDPERRWYRLHHLFAEILRAILERTEPDTALRVLARASNWHEGNGTPEAALEYAMAAGDETRAADLVVRLVRIAANAGRVETARRWFAWFDARGTALQPRLAAFGAITLAIVGDEFEARRWLAAADAAGQRVESGAGDPGLPAIARVLIDPEASRVLTDADTAMRVLGEDDAMASAAHASMGVALWLTGAPGWEEVLAEAVERGVAEGRANISMIVALSLLGAGALERGERAAAEAHVRQARAILRDNDMTEISIAAAIDALDARLLLGRGLAAQARAAVAHAQRIRIQLGPAVPVLAVRARLDLVRAMIQLGDSAGARILMAEVREILAARPDLGPCASEAAEVDERLKAVAGGTPGASSLTMAEWRLLPLLPTHLSFREIGERLFVTQNTIKTQAMSIYRKLDATSRSEAIQQAVALGLLESAMPGGGPPGIAP